MANEEFITSEEQSAEPTHGDELRAKVVQLPGDVVDMLYDTYNILKRVHRYGDWDAEYYGDASKLWDRLGDWMYPSNEEKEVEKP